MFVKDHDNSEVVRLKTEFLKGFLKFLNNYKQNIEYVNHIFNLCRKDASDVTIKKKSILTQLKNMGILPDDPRFVKMREYFEESCEDDIDVIELTKALKGEGIDINNNVKFLEKVMTSDLKIANFSKF